MRRRYWWGIMTAILLLAACDGNSEPPATEFVIITPAPTQQLDQDYEVTIAVLSTENAQLSATIIAYEATPASITVEPTTETSVVTPISQPSTTPMPTETIRPSAFPTPRVEIVSVVEQVFEGGRMIWFRDTRRVGVLIGDEVDPTAGQWMCFQDTFVEGDIEMLPTLLPPTGTTTTSQFPDSTIQQPIRGFGKIWRENPEVFEGLGWALTSEIEHSAVYEVIAGGLLDENGVYVPGPSEYRVQSFYDGATILLYESELGMECPSGRWSLRRPN